jgi:phenylacetate-CoA ligase
MDFYKYINKFLVYPLYYFKSGDKRLVRLSELENNQYLEVESLNELRVNKIKDIVTYAYEHTQYYRNLLDKNNLVPEDITSIADLEKIPVLTKSDIQIYGDHMLSDIYNKKDLIKDASGGSTGEPTIFFKDLSYHQLRSADQLRHDRWSGWDLGDRFALIWGAQRDLKATQSFREFIVSRYIARIWELDAFEMNKIKMDAYVKTLEKIQPKMILGYANALVAFSEFLIKNYPNHLISPKGIISSAETLTQSKRETIEKAFGCKVLNRYGSREVGLIASECQQQSGLHINVDNVHVEIVKNGKVVPIGESGDILVTDLSNKGMPLIRYSLGDIGRLSKEMCSCGRTLPLMKSVEGRSGDFFVAHDGSLVHGEYFTHLFYGIEGVIKFQMVQESLVDIQLKIVSKDNRLKDTDINNIKNKTREILGKQCNMNVEYVKSIPPTASGKSLFTISKVSR